MGVSHLKSDGAPLAPGEQQDAILNRVATEISDKGFVVAQMDKLAAWAQSGSTVTPGTPWALTML